ncbi:P-type ATPase [Aquisphaera insulae]|uniref:P-type ATPase n=1 Tax=Aquisphaera insulae TaxID=2712864 RepID=UPI0013EDFFA3|nr:hypothetical protein [Aquisphaera insulae]
MSIDARIEERTARTRVERGRAVVSPSNHAAIPDGGGDLPPVSFASANAAVTLAVVSDFVFPPAWPVAAATLVGMNLRAFETAARQVRGGRIEVPALYSTIAGLTIVTGQFLPWAAMSWAMRFWKRGYRDELASARDRLRADLGQGEGPVRLRVREGLTTDIPPELLRPGEVVLLGPGDSLPLDGRILQGVGLIDDRPVRGGRGYRRGRAEDDVLAGSKVISGSFLIELRRPANESRASTLTRIALGAAGQAPGERTPSRMGEAFASRAVLPTLTAAGVGLMVGDAPTALATLRADYASGPGLSYPLERLRALSECSRRGIVVRDPSALDRLAEVDVVLVEDLAALSATELEVAAVRVFPGHDESEILRFAASALFNLDDRRASALRSACRARKLSLLRAASIDHGADLALSHGGRVIKVGDVGRERSTRPEIIAGAREPDTLMVGIDGQIAGLIEFRPSARLRAASDLAALRVAARRPLAIGLLSRSNEDRARARAAALGMDFHLAIGSSQDPARLVERCRDRNLKIAFVGECLASPAVARAAAVAVSIDADPVESAERNPAQVLLLQPDLGGLSDLADAAREYRQQVRAAEKSAVIPNLACVAGALFFGFNSMTNVAITNLGTLATYVRTMRNLRGAHDGRQTGRRTPPVR